MKTYQVVLIIIGLFITILLLGSAKNQPSFKDAGRSYVPHAQSNESVETRVELARTASQQRFDDYINRTVGTTGSRSATLRELADDGHLSDHAYTITLDAHGAGNKDPDSEYIAIYVSPQSRVPINLSRWSVQSSVTGKKITVGNAVTLPIAGSVMRGDPVIAPPGSTLYLTSGSSPVGFSFQTNRCIGYFEQFNNFTPRLRRECPLPEEQLGYDELSGPNRFSDACLDIIEDIRQCEIYTRVLPITLSSSCQRFISQKVNYNSCVRTYKDGGDFYRNEWRLFYNSTDEIWKDTRESIQLLDEDNKVVDIISY